VAVLLVVLYHAGVPGLSGGFIGVDVFFVVSGFVITGLLLRERAVRDKTDLVGFYARRSRRILPAATLVIILTVLGSYHWLGFLTGDATAQVGKTASLFYSNFHFVATGTNYLDAQQPPSALQNFWSLSVEEQFYVVYPTILILTALLWSKISLRLKLGVVLMLAIAASFVWSIVETSSNEVAAYFSPFTRAWELALGGLVAVGSLQLAKMPLTVLRLMTWVGLGGILLAAFSFSSQTPYPGWADALPVVATALIIAGGTVDPSASTGRSGAHSIAVQPRSLGVESILRLPPFQWLGKLSYSLYLWHWPILIIAAQYAGHSLSVTDNLLWVLLALAFSIASYWMIENPIRHFGPLMRSRSLSLLLGGICIVLSVSLLTFEIHSHS
jgi:peptidoglycan/LPS O-acetylase OafA/YrhL